MSRVLGFVVVEVLVICGWTVIKDCLFWGRRIWIDSDYRRKLFRGTRVNVGSLRNNINREPSESLRFLLGSSVFGSTTDRKKLRLSAVANPSPCCVVTSAAEGLVNVYAS